MTKTNLAFLPEKTKTAVLELAEELGMKDPGVLVRKAVEDKLLEFRRAAFFDLSDRVRAGLRRKGTTPAAILKLCKS